MSWASALNTLRAAAGRWTVLAENNVSIAVAPSEARDLATALGAIVVEMEEANHAAMAARAALLSNAKILADWAGRLEVYAGSIAECDRRTADIIRGLAREVRKVTVGTPSENE